ncbi:MAG: glycosyltransferase family 1 protein [Cytophagales bacterium]|nr:glycosyltransferase family 4 protein [Bernardetiaceae bacterium]MDW8211618.1 glycosyltransferase family 1 protein [Cytophagales bacterium]
MKVGLYSGSLYAEEGGGFTIEREIIEALRILADEKFCSFILYAHPHQISIGESQNFSICLIKKPFLPRLLFKAGLLDYHPLQKQVIATNPDIIFYLSPWENFQVDIPYINIVWDLQHRRQPFFPEVSSKGEWEKRHWYYSQYLPKASYVITGNKAGAEEISFFYGVHPERIFLIPHLTPQFALDHASKRQLRPSWLPNGEYLFYPAQFWAHKNHITLLHALAKVHQRGFLLHLVLTGSDKGNLSYIKQTVSRLGLDNWVHFPGFVSKNEIVALYQHAFALIYPTHFGPENLPPLEAFGLGCPVLASAVAGAEEQLGEAALLFSPSSEEEMAAAILQLRDNPSLAQQMIKRGRQIAQMRSRTHFADRFKELLKKFALVRRCWQQE